MRRGKVLLIGSMAVLLWLHPGVSAGHDPAHHAGHEAQSHEAEAPSEGVTVQRSRLAIPDVSVVTQDGSTVRFYTDLVQGKVAAINFIYTTCTTVCPVLGAAFAAVQDQMKGRSGKDFHLISVSVDPVTDTPERLKAWAAKFNARPGWTLVTGKKQDIATLLKALGASTAGKEDHPPLVLIGNEPQGLWTRAYGLVPLTELIDGVIAGSVTAAPARR